ncbi:MAG: tetratricopeptide repeat protein [Acidobacteria bacterium]|nr:tetratricopeptide repeat protein [Acidobacteriota bacterium]
MKACIHALENAVEIDPEYAPAILTLGSVKYQQQEEHLGRELFLSLVSLPADTMAGGAEELAEIIDEAGDFLIESDQYADGLELYQAAVVRFPDDSILHQGLSCCAGHLERHEEAIAASRRAVELEPENQKHVNDLGWSYFQAGRLEEARETLTRAVDMDPEYKLARTNLRLCREAIKQERADE